MFQRFKARQRNRQIVDSLYEAIVRQARTPKLYVEFGIADTVMGRFEALSLHVFMFLARAGVDASLQALSHDLVDRFMVDLEHSIRELGVGDLSVPKRMKKLAGMFYARVRSYDAPFQNDDCEFLARALKTYAIADTAPTAAAVGLASYMLQTKDLYFATASDRFLSGELPGLA